MNVCVLLSGGFDSAYCLRRAIKRHGSNGVWCLFADYGQPYLEAERRAVASIAAAANVRCHEVKLDAMAIDGRGTFAHRNLRLVDVAQAFGAETVYIGTRNPVPLFDKHGDSNAVVLLRHARWRNISLRMPALCLPKWWIRAAVRTSFPEANIYSSEGYTP